MIDTIKHIFSVIPTWMYIYTGIGLLIAEFNYAVVCPLEDKFIKILGDENIFGQYTLDAKQSKKLFRRLIYIDFIADLVFWPIRSIIKIMRALG